MPASSIHKLAEQFCEIIGVPAPELSPDSNAVLAFSTQIGGVDISVTHDPLHHPDHATALVFFGQVPEDREVLILRELLHANLLMLRPDAPTFSRNPLTGNVILQYVFPLAGSSGRGLWTGMQGIIEYAQRWRRDFFLEQPAAMPRAPQFAAIENRA